MTIPPLREDQVSTISAVINTGQEPYGFFTVRYGRRTFLFTSTMADELRDVIRRTKPAIVLLRDITFSDT